LTTSEVFARHTFPGLTITTESRLTRSGVECSPDNSDCSIVGPIITVKLRSYYPKIKFDFLFINN
jgi:hypothetical protein